jgi:WD40 repeat protein
MTGAACGDLQCEPRATQIIAFSPNSKLIASGDSAKLFLLDKARGRLWNCATGALLTEVFVARPINSLSYSGDSSYFVTDMGLIPSHLWTSRSAGAQGISIYGYAIVNQWLTYNQAKLLWRPHELRTVDMSANSQTVALLASDSRAFVVSSDFDAECPWEPVSGDRRREKKIVSAELSSSHLPRCQIYYRTVQR